MLETIKVPSGINAARVGINGQNLSSGQLLLSVITTSRIGLDQFQQVFEAINSSCSDPFV